METSVYIEGTKYTVPSYITAAQWATISENPESKKWFIATVMNIPFSELNELKAVDIETIWLFGQHIFKDLETAKKSHLDFERLTFGQWVDLDVLATENPHTKIVAITTKLLEEDTSQKRLRDVWPHFREYIEWRNNVYQDYKNLFGLDGEYAEEEGPGVDITQVWYDAIMVLADQNFINIDEVVEKPFRQALNYLAWKKDQADKQADQMKKIQTK